MANYYVNLTLEKAINTRSENLQNKIQLNVVK